MAEACWLADHEVANAIHADFKQRGISWTLLDHIARFAVAKGITTLERERGWTASSCRDDPTLIVLRRALESGGA